MTDEELIKRLRKYKDDLLSITADRIEALVKEKDRRTEMHECAMSERDDATLYADEQKARAERLEVALRAWTETIATVMPKDFKDWHQNSPDEWPLVTVRVIKSLQEQLDLFLDQSVTVGMEQLRAAFDAGCENGWDHARWESVYDPQPLGCEDAFNKFLAALNLTPVDNTNR